MNNAEEHSVIIDIPKRRNHNLINTKGIKKREKLKSTKILRTEQLEDSMRLQVNSVSYDSPLRVNAFTKEGEFLSYKFYAKRQEKIIHKKKIAVGICEKYKILNADLHNRLHIDTSYDNVHAIQDVDVDFFSCFTGRPFFQYVLPFKSLIYLFNQRIRLNQKLGFRKDSILNTVASHRKEKETYVVAVNQYIEQSKYFDNFISNDYHDSMKCLIICDQLVLKVNEKISELQSLANEKFTITSRLIVLNYLYGHHQKYGRFLYYLSPPLWRLKNREFARSVEIEAKGFDFGIFSEEDTFNEIFENMKKECAGDFVRPAIYFSNPNYLLKIFNGIEKQQLHNFIHVIHMAPHTKSLMDRIEQLRDAMVKDTAGVVNNIKSFEKLLTFYDDVCFQLKQKFFRLIYGSFYDDVGSFEVLKLKLHLEFCYEKVYLDKPINMDILSLSRALEIFYMEYSKRLEVIHNEKIKTAVLHNVQVERNKFRRAKVAAKELQLFHRLERSLQRAYEPTVENNVPDLSSIKSTSPSKIFNRVNVNKNTLRILSEAEREYLTLFTDWTDNEDPDNYLQSSKILQEEKVSSDTFFLN